MSCTALTDRRLKYIPIKVKGFVRSGEQRTLHVHCHVRSDSIGLARVTNILKTTFVFHVPYLSHPYEGQQTELLYIYYDATTHYQ